jgi:hypothetical protein
MSFSDMPHYGILPLRVRVLFKYSIANKLQNPQNSFRHILLRHPLIWNFAPSGTGVV